MPGGFIQLLATGKESEYLNDTPHISFFKCYFRRHTNFFINNIEIYSNYHEKNEFNTFYYAQIRRFTFKRIFKI